MNISFSRNKQMAAFGPLLALAAFGAGGGNPARAGAVQITQPTPGDTVLTFPDSYSSPQGYTGTVAGTTLTFTEPGKYIFTDVPGFFNVGGNALLFGNINTNPAGLGQIDFSQGVKEVGFQAQVNLSGISTPEHFTFTAFNGVTSLGTYTVFGDAFLGQNPYLGVQATGGDLITKVVVTGFNDTAAFNGPGPFAFAIGPVSFAAPRSTVPEPSSWASFGIGILGLSALGLRARRKKAKLA